MPNYDVREIVANLRRLMNGIEPLEMVRWLLVGGWWREREGWRGEERVREERVGEERLEGRGVG